MACPKRKRSRARQGSRSANKGLDVQTFTFCPNSGAPVMPHTVCLESGFYKGIKVLSTKADRSAKRAQRRQTLEARKAGKTPTATAEQAKATEGASDKKD